MLYIYIYYMYYIHVYYFRNYKKYFKNENYKILLFKISILCKYHMIIICIIYVILFLIFKKN